MHLFSPLLIIVAKIPLVVYYPSKEVATISSRSSLVLSRVLVPLSFHSHTRLKFAQLKKLSTVLVHLEDDLLEKNVRTNALITFDNPLRAYFYSTKMFHYL